MSKTLALLSGKGGSGKTTLALSLASMLSECRLKVLLVDCDLITNGATYFYEGKLNREKNKLCSFRDQFLNVSVKKDIDYLMINECLSFMPSVVQITRENSESYRYDERYVPIVKDIIHDLKEKFDIIIFDCQAGYTDVLRLLLPIVDINLFVMEADAISSSSIRSLYLKIGYLLNDRTVYQIFNKATDEEYEIYSKISGGTVFTNIETVKFDWKIRKAFSVAQIPDMENTSAVYLKQIYNIAKVIFKEDSVQNKLKHCEISIKRQELKEEEIYLKSLCDNLESERKPKGDYLIRLVYYALVPTILCLAISYYFIYGIRFNSLGPNGVLMLIYTVGILIMTIYLASEATKGRRKRSAKLMEIRTRIGTIQLEKRRMERERGKAHFEEAVSQIKSFYSDDE